MKKLSIILLLLLIGCKSPIQKQDIVLDKNINDIKKSIKNQKEIIKDVKVEVVKCNNEILTLQIDNLEKETDLLEERVNKLEFEKTLLIKLVETELRDYKILKRIIFLLICGLAIYIYKRR